MWRVALNAPPGVAAAIQRRAASAMAKVISLPAAWHTPLDPSREAGSIAMCRIFAGRRAEFLTAPAVNPKLGAAACARCWRW